MAEGDNAPTAWIVLTLVNVPLYVALGWVFFRSWAGFVESLKYSLKPDIISHWLLARTFGRINGEPPSARQVEAASAPRFELRRDGEVYGPYPIARLAQFLAAERIDPEDRLRLEGEETWRSKPEFIELHAERRFVTADQATGE